MLGLVTLSSACASKGFVAGPSVGGAEPEYKEPLTVAEIEALKPQLELPVRLAVSQPTTGGGWTPDELEIIQAWEGPLKALGLVSGLVVLPESFSNPSCGWRSAYFCGLRGNRATAARFHADAVLLISRLTETRGYANPLSVLNVTVVGMWLIPGHHRVARSTIEGTVVDTRNEYLYAFARAHGTSHKRRPLVYARQRPAIRTSQIEALKAFGDRLLSELESLAPE